MKPREYDVVFLFDVDHTLLDNDRVQNDLWNHLERTYSRQARDRCLEIFEELRANHQRSTFVNTPDAGV
jgi:hypothetical protein